jgi:tagaturonate epimerase
MMKIEKFTFGVGDRFAHQARAQLRAFQLAAEQGVEIVPVWNKSNREHLIVGSEPSTVKAAAEAAVRQAGWNKPWHVDADHINLDTVDRFIEPSDFYTIDVAHFIGSPAKRGDVDAFVARHPELIGTLRIPGIEEPITSTPAYVSQVAAKYLAAVTAAAEIYRHIGAKKGPDRFITEVSMDETDCPQTPPDLLIILAAIADAKIPLQTIAPKFTGRFNKGVDYVGDTAQFAREFSDDLAVIAYAIAKYRLPETLKLSVHSGSDKFSIYAAIRNAIRRTGAGLHLKTAGTTWLEELIGLAEAGPDGLALAREVYREAFDHRKELCEPYGAVIDIDSARLPSPDEVNGWTAVEYTDALRHVPANPNFNPNVRQLLHVGYKVAAKMGDRYLKMLERSEESISRNVAANLFDRHIRPLFLD